MCKCGGFSLTKFLLNSKEILETISACDRKDRKKKMVEQLANPFLPAEVPLEVLWDVEKDVFTFRVKLKEKPRTRRNMLSTLSSNFYPLGLVFPSILKGRKLLQQMCTQNVKWDEPVSDKILEEWEKWKTSVKQLSDVKVDMSQKKGLQGDQAL